VFGDLASDWMNNCVSFVIGEGGAGGSAPLGTGVLNGFGATCYQASNNSIIECQSCVPPPPMAPVTVPPPVDLVCEVNCTMNGLCEIDRCICNTGFDGLDCSCPIQPLLRNATCVNGVWISNIPVEIVGASFEIINIVTIVGNLTVDNSSQMVFFVRTFEESSTPSTALMTFFFWCSLITQSEE